MQLLFACLTTAIVSALGSPAATTVSDSGLIVDGNLNARDCTGVRLTKMTLNLPPPPGSEFTLGPEVEVTAFSGECRKIQEALGGKNAVGVGPYLFPSGILSHNGIGGDSPCTGNNLFVPGGGLSYDVRKSWSKSKSSVEKRARKLKNSAKTESCARDCREKWETARKMMKYARETKMSREIINVQTEHHTFKVLPQRPLQVVAVAGLRLCTEDNYGGECREFASRGHTCVNIPSDFAPRVSSMRTFSRPVTLNSSCLIYACVPESTPQRTWVAPEHSTESKEGFQNHASRKGVVPDLRLGALQVGNLFIFSRECGASAPCASPGPTLPRNRVLLPPSLLRLKGGTWFKFHVPIASGRGSGEVAGNVFATCFVRTWSGRL
ncbi:hypothetical protein B0H16DRAFT_1691318 [Mycena metata]|uniref:Uncharacterized protein n=1 Tax=Mycena metata TaxID=1033252 RepID=A0AAD7N9W7_9AGAR|nr:hypothetical protein B0H16DRAFT_1691318 [Mycena metata]